MGCGETSPAPYYEHSVRALSHVHLQVHSDGQPLVGAQVQLSALVGESDEYGQPELQGPELLWQGATDAQGEIDVPVNALVDRSFLRVLVHAPGFEGPYSNLSEKALLGPWAPAALVQVPLQREHNLSFNMRALPDSAAATSLGSVLRSLWLERWASPGTHWHPQGDAGLLVQQDTTLSIRGLSAASPYDTALGYMVREAASPHKVLARGLLERGAHRDGAQDILRDALGNPRLFRAGERVDFFIVPDGWSGSDVRGWSPEDPQLPFLEPVGNMFVNVASSDAALNPELAHACSARSRRVVSARVRTADSRVHHVLGFEELTRTRAADDDFNDLLFEVVPDVASSLLSPAALSLDAQHPDPDRDGVAGLQDAFPLDPERSHLLRVPDRGYGVLALEEGDLQDAAADYNDAVVHYRYELVLDAAGDVRSLVGTFYSVSQGERAPVALGLALHDLPERVRGTLGLQRVNLDGSLSTLSTATLLSLRQASGAVLVQDLLPAPEQVAPQGQALTWQAPLQAARFKISFDTAVSRSLLSPEALEPFFSSDSAVFLKASGRGSDSLPRPRILDLPGSWQHARQGTSIVEAYPDFEVWIEHKGLEYPGWYQRPSGVAGRVMQGPDLDLDAPQWIQGVAR